MNQLSGLRAGLLGSVTIIGLWGLLAPMPAQATKVIAFSDASTTEWQVSYPDWLDLAFEATVPTSMPMGGNRNTAGKLTDKTVRTDLAPAILTFTQLELAPNDTVTNGLRLLFETETKNSAPKPWVGFKLSLIDLPLAAFSDEAHPAEAHFHARNGATYGLFSDFAAPGLPSNCPEKVAPDVSCNMLVRDGVHTVAPTQTLEIRRLLLHERAFSPADYAGANINISDDGTRREFQMILQPIAAPEPGSLAIAATGLALLAATRALRRRRPE